VRLVRGFFYSQIYLQQNVHGLVQRLVQREKEVLQLRTELDRFKMQNPGDGREAVCIVPLWILNDTDILLKDERAKRERDRIKWNTLMEEITKHKTKVYHLLSSTVHI
jgi:diaphanous 1